MLAKILILSSTLFAVIYPLCFLMHIQDPLKNNFHRFHLGISCFVAGLVNIFLYQLSIPDALKFHFGIWTFLLFALSFFYWTQAYPQALAFLIPFAYGKWCLFLLLKFWGIPHPFLFFIVLLDGFIFCASLYAMNLGHWYLNVHGLPIAHLQRAVYMFWILTGVRVALDLVVIFTQNVFYNGEWIPLAKFMLSMDGFMIWLGLLFGTLFPSVTLYFVKGTLDVKSNQSATGILYAILCGLIIGDITAKYYLFKYTITF